MSKSLKCFVCMLFVIQATNGFAQTLPYQLNYFEGTHHMTVGGNPPSDLYDINVIREINLLFYVDDWYDQLLDTHGTELAIPARLVYNGDTLPADVGVYFRGHSSFFANDSIKKSVGITLDYIDSLQNIDGSKTLNLNCSFRDTTFMHEAIYENLIQKYIPALSVNYVHLYLNDLDFGLYTNVQQLDKIYLKDWFITNDGSLWRAERTDGATDADPGGANGTGFSTLNYLGMDTSVYKNYYTLKETSISHPWEDIIDVCDPLENMPADVLEDTINKYLDLDRTLWYMAAEILFTDEDSYVHKGGMDYFLYWEPETDRLVPLEYDGNSVMDSMRYKWKIFYKGTDTNYALSYHFFAIPSIRQRYLAHFRTMFNEIYTEENLYGIIDDYFELIDPYVATDPVKLVSYDQFLYGIDQLKETIANRRAYILDDNEFDNPSLNIENVKWISNGYNWGVVNSIQPVTISAQISGAPDVKQITLYYSTEIFGPFTKLIMYDDGLHGDQLAGDLIFASAIPNFPVGTKVRFYVEATADDDVFTKSYNPEGAEHDVYYYEVKTDYIEVNNFTNNYFTLLPNPASSFLYVHCGNPGNENLEIYSITGAKVFEAKLTVDMEINVATWSPGLYIAKTTEFAYQIIVQ